MSPLSPSIPKSSTKAPLVPEPSSRETTVMAPKSLPVLSALSAEAVVSDVDAAADVEASPDAEVEPLDELPQPASTDAIQNTVIPIAINFFISFNLLF